MPHFAATHPQFVHFAIALLLVGVAFRWVSLTGRLTFTTHSAGVRAAVTEHEALGERARNVFFLVAAVELPALGLAAGAKTAGFAKLNSLR